jgi:anti-anti-sigma factor
VASDRDVVGARRVDATLIQDFMHNDRAAAERPTVELHISRASPDERTIQITPVGEIDIITGGTLRAAISSALAERPKRLIVDLAGVSFADSQLVHALCLVLGEHASGRVTDLRVVGARPQIVRVLAVCSLDHLCAERS